VIMNATAIESTTVRGSIQTPVGMLTVIAAEDGIVGVGWRHRPAPAAPSGDSVAAAQLSAALTQLREYFAGQRTTFDLPIRLTGLGGTTTAVLTALRDTVRYGETVTYGELAARSGGDVPARAIGSIMGSNPVPILIPCHRVVASDGLGGYSGGERGRGRETKVWLLEHEGALPPALI
jgi:methylated-DNA-[protein]-cysteine S-methyltransferase